jgi:predicted signal transduction protein with EAL and GGDEF domain
MFTLRWWHVCMTDMSGPGPAFSWIVLVAIFGFGLVAPGLLTAGQFVRIGAPAVGLAIGTVLIGMARAASTVRERLRESELQAVTDPLTGLGNRRHLLDQLDAKIGRGAERRGAAGAVADRSGRVQAEPVKPGETLRVRI